jgi:hypothetical protein
MGVYGTFARQLSNCQGLIEMVRGSKPARWTAIVGAALATTVVSNVASAQDAPIDPQTEGAAPLAATEQTTPLRKGDLVGSSPKLQDWVKNGKYNNSSDNAIKTLKLSNGAIAFMSKAFPGKLMVAAPATSSIAQNEKIQWVRPFVSRWRSHGFNFNPRASSITPGPVNPKSQRITQGFTVRETYTVPQDRTDPNNNRISRVTNDVSEVPGKQSVTNVVGNMVLGGEHTGVNVLREMRPGEVKRGFFPLAPAQVSDYIAMTKDGQWASWFDRTSTVPDALLDLIRDGLSYSGTTSGYGKNTLHSSSWEQLLARKHPFVISDNSFSRFTAQGNINKKIGATVIDRIQFARIDDILHAVANLNHKSIRDDLIDAKPYIGTASAKGSNIYFGTSVYGAVKATRSLKAK